MAILALSLLEMTLSPAEAGAAKGAAKAKTTPAATHVRRDFPYTSCLNFFPDVAGLSFPRQRARVQQQSCFGNRARLVPGPWSPLSQSMVFAVGLKAIVAPPTVFFRPVTIQPHFVGVFRSRSGAVCALPRPGFAGPAAGFSVRSPRRIFIRVRPRPSASALAAAGPSVFHGDRSPFHVDDLPTETRVII